MELSTAIKNYTTITQIASVLELLTAAITENRNDVANMCVAKYNELKNKLI